MTYTWNGQKKFAHHSSLLLCYEGKQACRNIIRFPAHSSTDVSIPFLEKKKNHVLIADAFHKKRYQLL